MRFLQTCAVAIAVLGMQAAFAAAPDGWVCFAGENGHVYRVEVGGSPEDLTGDVNASHACWSYDGSLIFYIKGNGDIHAIHNDGSNDQQIGNADHMNYSPIAAYRAHDKSVLCVDNNTFYRINAETGDKTEVADAGKNVVGEIAVSSDGNRIAFRAGDNNLYKLQVGGNPDYYAGYCSASISPNGQYLTENGNGHAYMKVYNWGGGSETINIDVISTWDNQAFAANSDEWICAVGDNSVGANKGSECAVANRSTKEVYLVSDWNNPDTKYPRFFYGSLPSVDNDDTTPPTAPSGLENTSAANTSLSFSWNAATDDESGISEYRLYFGNDLKATTSSTSATVTGLTRNTQYSDIYVVAVNGVDSVSAHSNTISAATTDQDVQNGTFFLCAVGDATSLSNGMETASVSGSQCNEVIYATQDGGNTDHSTSDSKAEYTVNLAAGDWYLWGRTQFTSDGGNSWWVAVDGNVISGTQFVNEPPIDGTTDTWHWEGDMRNDPFPLGSLSEGSHTITIYSREAANDNYLDKLCLTMDSNLDPTDLTVVAPDSRKHSATTSISRSTQPRRVYAVNGQYLGTLKQLRSTNALSRLRGTSVLIVIDAQGKRRILPSLSQ